MSFPNLKNKHLQEALFHPSDFIKHRGWKGKFPKRYIITYQKRIEKYFIRKYKPKKIELNSLLTIWIHKKVGLVRITGIGAPNATGVLEELIALGGKEFINVGTSGGLHKEGIFLCEKALRDEGTSHHYIKPGKYSYPDKELTKRLEKSLTNSKINFQRGTTWTTDAIYRETRKEVEEYSKKGISTVEMEASALFAVAKYRKIRLASAFVVSDILNSEINIKFPEFDIQKAHKQLIDIALNCLLEK